MNMNMNMNMNMSLQSLYDFIQNPENKKELTDNNLNPSCILNYYYFTNESFSKGHYYLGGQLKLHIDDVITESHIQEVQSIMKKRNQDDYANYWEYSSCMTHERNFNDFIKIFFYIYNKKKQKMDKEKKGNPS